MMSVVTGVLSIASARESAQALPSGSRERDVAELQADVLEHVRECLRLAADGTSQACSQIEAMKNGVPNPERPYLTWKCCTQHEALRSVRDGLESRAQELGIRLIYDYSRPIEV